MFDFMITFISHKYTHNVFQELALVVKGTCRVSQEIYLENHGDFKWCKHSASSPLEALFPHQTCPLGLYLPYTEILNPSPNSSPSSHT
jgi:hypothetical protein